MTKLTEDRAFAQNYFDFIASAASSSETTSTSNDQFAKGEVPEPAEQRELLKSFDQLKGHARQIVGLSDLCRSSLITCAPQLRAGFNFLCYGLGRKQDLLDQVIPEIFYDYNVFTLTGSSEAALNLGPIAFFNCLLNTIQSNLFPRIQGFNSDSASKSSIVSKTELICSQKSPEKSIILLHQLDSPTFRSPVIFDCLLKLINSINCQFSLIASIDNPALMNLFSKARFEEFNWIWMDCTTMLPYTEELNRFALDACTNSAARQTPRAAIIVLQSLTTNSRSIFKLLAAHQLSCNEGQVSFLIDSFEDEDESSVQVETTTTGPAASLDGYNGMSYHGLFQKCQENFVVTAEANFRTQLTEFTDHDLFKSIEGRDGSVMFFIPFYHNELKQIIQDI